MSSTRLSPSSLKEKASMAKTSGVRVKLTLFVKFDPKNPASIAHAANLAEKLKTHEGLKTLGENIEIEEASTNVVSRKSE